MTICIRCSKRWSGTLTAHCASCHRTFSGVTHFDAHRKYGECHTPEEVGLVQLSGRSYECFGLPNAPKETDQAPQASLGSIGG